MGCNSSLPATATIQPLDQEKTVEQRKPEVTTAAKNDLPTKTANTTGNNSLPKHAGNRKKHLLFEKLLLFSLKNKDSFLTDNSQ